MSVVGGERREGSTRKGCRWGHKWGVGSSPRRSCFGKIVIRAQTNFTARCSPSSSCTSYRDASADCCRPSLCPDTSLTSQICPRARLPPSVHLLEPSLFGDPLQLPLLSSAHASQTEPCVPDHVHHSPTTATSPRTTNFRQPRTGHTAS
jgi:hypothetical protein